MRQRPRPHGAAVAVSTETRKRPPLPHSLRHAWTGDKGAKASAPSLAATQRGARIHLSPPIPPLTVADIRGYHIPIVHGAVRSSVGGSVGVVSSTSNYNACNSLCCATACPQRREHDDDLHACASIPTGRACAIQATPWTVQPCRGLQRKYAGARRLGKELTERTAGA